MASSRRYPSLKSTGASAFVGFALIFAVFVTLPSSGGAAGSSWGRASTQSWNASKFLSSTLVGDTVGNTTVLTGREVRRFLADGTQDLPYGANAAVTLAGATVSHLAVQASGRIVVVGTRPNSNGQLVVELTRLGFDGLLDTSFGVAGKASVLIEGGPTVVPSEIFVDPLGRITTVVSPGGSGSGVAYLHRWRAWGAIDTNFGTQGLLRVPLQNVDGIAGQGSIVATWEDGSFLIDSGAQWTKFLTNGSLDLTFGSNGSVTPTLPILPGENGPWVPSISKAVAISGGRLLVVSLANDIDGPTVGNHLVVTRLSPLGLPDLSFGTNGTVIPVVSPGDGQTDRVLLLGGVHRVGAWVTISGGAVSLQQAVLLRMTTDGVADPGFGLNGVMQVRSGGGCDDHVAAFTSVTCIAPIQYLDSVESNRVIQHFVGEPPSILLEPPSTAPLPPAIGSNVGRTAAPQAPEPEVIVGRRPASQTPPTTAKL